MLCHFRNTAGTGAFGVCPENESMISSEHPEKKADFRRGTATRFEAFIRTTDFVVPRRSFFSKKEDEIKLKIEGFPVPVVRRYPWLAKKGKNNLAGTIL